MVDALVITGLWVVTICLVNPSGNFPLNDDWSFAATVRRLLELGEFRPHDWTAMPVVTNVLWGALVGAPFGGSFEALRASTLVLALVGVLSAYALAREQGADRWLANAVGLTLGFNAVYLPLSFTFMTDAPFAALVILASLFLARNVRQGPHISNQLWLGGAFSVLASCSRQLGLAVPAAFAVTTLLVDGVSWRNLRRAMIPLALSTVALVGLHEWLVWSGRLPAMYDQRTGSLFRMATDGGRSLVEIGTNVHFVLLYLGLFLLPVLIPHVHQCFVAGTAKRSILVASVAAMVVATGFRYGAGKRLLMPIWRNVLTKTGVGPLTLRDTYILMLDHVPALPHAFWVVATTMSVAGAACLMACGVAALTGSLGAWKRTRRLSGETAAGVFLLLAAAIYLAPLVLAGFYDRYLIVVVPLVAAGLVRTGAREAAARTPGPIGAATSAVLVAYAVFAIGTTHDYLAWNRARWAAARDLMRTENVGPGRIDGGFEFNALYLYDAAYVEDPAKSWWWVDGDSYQISFGPIDGYEVVKEYPYSNWMLPRQGRILAQRRLASAE